MKNLNLKILVLNFLILSFIGQLASANLCVDILSKKSDKAIDTLMSTDPEIFTDSRVISKTAAQRDLDLLNAEAEIYDELLAKGQIREKNRDSKLYDSLIVPVISEQVFYFYLELMLVKKGYSNDEIKLLESDFHNLHFQKQLEFVHELVDYMAYNLPTYTDVSDLAKFKEAAEVLQISTDALGNFISKWNLMVLAEPSSLYWLVDSVLYERSKSTSTHRADGSLMNKALSFFKDKFSKSKESVDMISVEPPEVSKEISLRNLINGKSIFYSDHSKYFEIFIRFTEKLTPVGLFYFIKKYMKFFNFTESKFLMETLERLELLESLDKETYEYFTKRHNLLIKLYQLPENNNKVTQTTIDNLDQKIRRLENKKTNQNYNTEMNKDEFSRILLLVEELKESRTHDEVKIDLDQIFKLMNSSASPKQAYTVFEKIVVNLDKFKGKKPVLKHYLKLLKHQKKYPLTETLLNKLIGTITSITSSWGDSSNFDDKYKLLDTSKWTVGSSVAEIDLELQAEIDASKEKRKAYLSDFDSIIKSNEDLGKTRESIIQKLINL